ncbi:hypothetical protein CDG81_14460 [Actinopolyspora erythraea]|uniref:Uncharacterized protein n=1 Tax=Actinopolyspora erythraea TaxID=414996 RepID=A0A099D3G2_9ACTN|nr:hypothetical protein [Actinopolyspora erythraea]ASU79293.1 hypothetical protein CDG81_14460 [Actinopolyspora erythraea]KGI80723.1 hypothetical protein IL38_15310 [Actinopolyspora erythraea]
MTTQQSGEAAPTQPPKRAVSTAAEFVTGHGGSARAVVENLGRGGARIVLIGQDGALGDVLVPDPTVGEAVVEAVEGLELGDWDSETAAALTIGPAHRRKMAGSRAK